jgi:hypothetical protein
VKNKLLSLKSLALAALLSTAAAAHADITVYTSQTAFLAAVSAPGTDTFDDLAVAPYPSPLARMAGAYSYTAAADGGIYGAGSGTDHWLSTNIATDAITFSGFSPGVLALGGFFFGSDINGAFIPGTTMTLTATSGETRTITLDDTTAGTFLGFVSTSQLSSVVLNATQPATYPAWPTVNDLTLAVPEPASYAMLLAGLGLAGFAARRRAA